MTLCQILYNIQEGTTGRVESMQQSSATPKKVGLELRIIVACQPYLWCLLVSTVFWCHPYNPDSSMHILGARAKIRDVTIKWHATKRKSQWRALDLAF